MTTDVEKQPTEIERLVSLLKQVINEQPSEAQLAELGDSLLSAVKAALSGESSQPLNLARVSP